MSATTGKLFFRDQNGVIYEFSGNIPVYITDTGIGIDTDDEDDFHLVRSDATIRDYEAVINDLAEASAGNIGFVLDRLLDRDTLMPSEDAAKIIRNVPADKDSIAKLYNVFRMLSDVVSWFDLAKLMDLEEDGDAATLAAMRFKKLVGAKQAKPGEHLSRFLMEVFKPKEETGAMKGGISKKRTISSLVAARSAARSNNVTAFPKEQLLKFATFWVILSEKLSAAYTTKGQ